MVWREEDGRHEVQVGTHHPVWHVTLAMSPASAPTQIGTFAAWYPTPTTHPERHFHHCPLPPRVQASRAKLRHQKGGSASTCQCVAREDT